MKKKLMTLLASCALALGVSSSCFASNLGVVDVNAVYRNYAGFNQALQDVGAEKARLQEEFKKQSANLDDKGKAELVAKLNQQLAQFEAQKMEAVNKNVRKAINAVAKANKIEDVVNSTAMLSGGKDLTNEVIAALKK